MTHGYRYSPAAEAAAASKHTRRDGDTGIGRLLAGGLVLLFLGILGLHVAVQQVKHATDLPRPVRAPVVDVFELPAPPQSLADARIEGFRAGMAAATEQGCLQPITLSAPIAQR